MTIIHLPDTFLHNFEKTFRDQSITIDDFCKKIKETPFIHIKNPLFKYKFSIKGIAIRGFIIKKTDTIVVPVFIAPKNTPKGKNLILDATMAKKIDQLLMIYTTELHQGKYIIK